MIINGIKWGVRLVSPAHPMLLTPWGTHSYGVCDKATQTIFVDKTLFSRKLKEVIYHEIAHAIMFSYGIELLYDEEELVAELIGKYGDEIFTQGNIIYNGIKMK